MNPDGRISAQTAMLRVLIAGDDDDTRQRMVALVSRNCQVIGVVTNKELVQAATRMLPDVIVSDISTSRMDGMAASDKLIAQGKLIPFVFVCRESQQAINVLWGSFAFVSSKKISMHLVNAVEAVHSLAIYDSPVYPNLFDQQSENQNVVLIDEETLRKAEQMILSCERCNSEAQVLFCEILDRLTGSDPSVTDYILKKPGSCPRCFRAVTEQTLVELDDRG
jgi:CheY-like chemotaxis protein